MSIKAYTGFRMKAKHFPTVLAHLEKANERLRPILQHQQAQFLAHLTASLIDRTALAAKLGVPGPELGRGGALVTAFLAMAERQNKIRSTQHRDPAVDFELEYCLWHSRRLDSYIGLLQCERSGEMHDLLLRTGVASNYWYGNSGDAPTSIPARQWKQRADAWYDALYDKSGPSFIVKGPRLGMSTTEDVVRALPSFESRVEELAVERAFREYLAEFPKEERGDRAMSMVFEFRRLRKSDGTRPAELYAKAYGMVQEILQPELTKECLLRSESEKSTSG